MTDADALLTVEVLCITGAVSFLVFYAISKIRLRTDVIGPIERGADGLASYDVLPPIDMPSHLKTQDEIVGWMTRDLPKLTAKMLETDRP